MWILTASRSITLHRCDQPVIELMFDSVYGPFMHSTSPMDRAAAALATVRQQLLATIEHDGGLTTRQVEELLARLDTRLRHKFSTPEPFGDWRRGPLTPQVPMPCHRPGNRQR